MRESQNLAVLLWEFELRTIDEGANFLFEKEVQIL